MVVAIKESWDSPVLWEIREFGNVGWGLAEYPSAGTQQEKGKSRSRSRDTIF